MADPLSHVSVADLRSVSPYLGSASYALMSTSESVDSTAIFIHGFLGHPRRTWGRFHDLILGSPDWELTDVYFLEYASTKDEISLSASYISHFLRSILRGPPTSLLTAHRGNDTYRIRDTDGFYDAVRLIGHSEGGVVLRAMILDMLRQVIAPCVAADGVIDALQEYLQFWEADMLLFAPALAGARLSGIPGRVRKIVGLRAMIDLYVSGSPAFQELAQDSLLLRSLREDTTFFADKFPQVRSLRANILWAHYDNVVSSYPYRFDSCRRLLNSTHSSVCKPTADTSASYLFATSKPIADLEDVL